MEKKEPIKLGNGKKRSESWITGTLCLDEVKKHTYMYNGKEYFNINVNIRKEADKYGKDVVFNLNDYKAEKNETVSKTVNLNEEDDLPF